MSPVKILTFKGQTTFINIRTQDIFATRIAPILSIEKAIENILATSNFCPKNLTA